MNEKVWNVEQMQLRYFNEEAGIEFSGPPKRFEETFVIHVDGEDDELVPVTMKIKERYENFENVRSIFPGSSTQEKYLVRIVYAIEGAIRTELVETDWMSGRNYLDIVKHVVDDRISWYQVVMDGAASCSHFEITHPFLMSKDGLVGDCIFLETGDNVEVKIRSMIQDVTIVDARQRYIHEI